MNFTNGEHFTAKDVVYSINRLANTTTGASALTYIDLSGVEAVDDYTVKIKTTKPYAFLEAQLCQAVMCIVNEKAITEMGEDAHGRAPVGTGPYMVADWTAGESITLERNENYWGEPAKLKTVVLKIMTEGTSRTINLETGAIDLCRLQTTDIDRVEESSDMYVLAGAQNEVGARKFVDFMLSNEVQAQIPEQMYMDPVDSKVGLPADWKKYAAVVDNPITVPAAELGAKRDDWIKAWTAAVIG